MRLISIAIFFCLISVVAFGAELVPNQTVTLLQAGPDVCVFRVSVPVVEIQGQTVDGTAFARYGFAGADFDEQAGQPIIPFKRVLIALPPNSHAVATARVMASSQKAGPPPLTGPYLKIDAAGQTHEEWRVPPSDYLKSASKELVRVSEPEMFRYQQFVAVDVFPVQFQPGGPAIIRSEIEVTLHWQAVTQAQSFRPAPPDPLAEKLYQQVFINAAQAAAWRFIPGSAFSAAADVIFHHSTNWVKLKIQDEYDEDNDRYKDRNGIYKLTRADLTTAGIPNIDGIDLSSVRIFTNGGRQLPETLTITPQAYSEVPIVTSKVTGSFSSNDYILFYGQAQTGFNDEFGFNRNRDFYENPYANANYYWLTWGGDFPSVPKRLTTRSQTTVAGLTAEPYFIDKFHHEKNIDWLYQEGPALNDDDWVGDFLVGRGKVGGENFFYPFELPDKSPLSNQSTFRVAIQWKDESAAATLNFYINDPLAGTSGLLSGFGTYDATYTGEWVNNNNNRLRIQVDGGTGTRPAQLYLGWFSVEYARQFKAKDQRLKFRAPLGNQRIAQYQLTGFSGAVRMWDVTAPLNPIALEVDPGSGFQDSVFTTRQRVYCAASEAGFLAVNQAERVVFPNTLLHDGSYQVDYMIIAPADYHDELAPLAAWRRQSLISAYQTTPAPLTNPQVLLVDSKQVYDEFSGGYTDPAGIRNFLRYAYENWARPPVYVLFVSDANLDYRNYVQDSTPVINHVPTFQVPGNTGWATDDWLVWLNTGRNVDMINGRFPAETEEEVEAVVQKVLDYEMNPEWGVWRNRTVAIADDYCQPSGCSPSQIYFTTVEDDINRNMPVYFDNDEIFLTEYALDPNNRTKAKANQDLMEKAADGALMLRYTGHGGPPKMADESVFSLNNISQLDNGRRQMLWCAFSCDISNYDHYGRECIGEDLLLARDKGAIATIGGIRSTYGSPNQVLESRFIKALFGAEYISIGEALAIGKISIGNEINSSKYVLMGDPAQRLGAARLQVKMADGLVITQANRMQISGEIYEGEQFQADFNGTAYITVFSNRRTILYKSDEWSFSETWDHLGTPIFRGQAEVKNGRFNQTVFVPVNLEFGDNGRVSVYAWSEALKTDAAGAVDSIPIVSGAQANDVRGPEIQVELDGQLMLNAGIIYPQSTLKVSLEDSSGINLAGASEAGVLFDLVRQRNDPQNPVETIFQEDLTRFFEYEIGDYRRGTLTWQIPEMDNGEYVLRLRAIDNMNNAAIASYNVDIRDFTESAPLTISEAFNYPNPTPGATHFLFKVNKDNCLATIKIFTVSGRRIKTLGPEPAAGFPNQSRIAWDGRDEDGDAVANGVYLYKLLIDYESEDGPVQRIFVGKLMIHH